MAHHILIVDDDEFVRALIATHLENEGYEVSLAGSGEEMFDLMGANEFDLVLLDLGLPDEDGLVLARKLRARSGIPLMILTGRRELDDRLAGLDVGADDYLTKSVNPEEFLLRVRNLLNRSGGGTIAPVSSKDKSLIRFRGWTIDLDGHSLTSPDDEEVAVTPVELKLLSVLAKAPGRALSRDTLLDAISGYDEAPSDRMIDAFISRIRKKIEANPKKPEIIVTITGVGYRFDAKVE